MEDRPMTIREISERSGLPQAWIRAACKRGAAYHPLPHIESGETRPIFRIRMSAFEQWYAEEERMCLSNG